MERIIAGRFQTKGDGNAAAALIAQYAATSDICIFHNNPPGRPMVEQRVIDTLRAHSAAEIEQARGEIHHGDGS